MKLRHLLVATVLSSAAWAASSQPSNVLGTIVAINSPSAEAASVREIVISQNTRWINVTDGETVRLRIVDQGNATTIVFRFDGVYARSFDLAEALPQGLLPRGRVSAFVATNPLIGGA